jgi:hypothetical protein
MARRRRPSLALKAPLYPRRRRSRLMFGTPAARRPYLRLEKMGTFSLARAWRLGGGGRRRFLGR